MRRATTPLVLFAALCVPVAAAGADLRDPTRPPQGGTVPEPAGPAPALSLDFVINSRDRHLARINGQWVSEGDTVAGARVQRIEADRVLVRRRGQTSILKFGGSGIEKE